MVTSENPIEGSVKGYQALLDKLGVAPNQRDNFIEHISQFSIGRSWAKIEEELKELEFNDQKLEIIKKYRRDLSEENKVIFEAILDGFFVQQSKQAKERLSKVQKLSDKEFKQLINGICLSITEKNVKPSTGKSNNKYAKVSDYFNNPNDSRWKKFKRWVLESTEKLSNFVQDVTGIDPADPLKSIKEKFGGNKKKSKIPESDSKIVSNFLLSPNALIGGLVGVSALSTLAFFSPAVFLLVVPFIIGVVKVNSLISSDEEKEGTIHNPIRSKSEDYTELGTRTITCYDKMTTNHADKIKDERSKETPRMRG